MNFHKSLSLTKLVLVFMAALVALTNGAKHHHLKMSCIEDLKVCSLTSNEGDSNAELKVMHLQCQDDADSECKDSAIIAENHNFYLCKHANKRSGECKVIFDLEKISGGDSNVQDYYKEKQYFNEPKRQLPFESLNYGRRKRELPFETLNYGKRYAGLNSNCDCMQPYFPKRNLPFDNVLFGKRSLPFETLNYGKRGGIDIPIDGYIIGKRSK